MICAAQKYVLDEKKFFNEHRKQPGGIYTKLIKVRYDSLQEHGIIDGGTKHFLLILLYCMDLLKISMS